MNEDISVGLEALIHSVSGQDITCWCSWHQGIAFTVPIATTGLEAEVFLHLLDDVACTCSGIWPLSLGASEAEAYGKLSAITLIYNVQRPYLHFFKDGYLPIGIATCIAKGFAWTKLLFDKPDIVSSIARYRIDLFDFGMEIESLRILLLLRVLESGDCEVPLQVAGKANSMPEREIVGWRNLLSNSEGE